MEKYCEIENSYRNKFINYFEETHNIWDDDFVILEKIDGACFRIHIDLDGNITYGTRKRILKPGEKFYNWQEAVNELDLTSIINSTKKKEVELTLYGEIFSNSIQKRVKYQDNSLITFFDVKYNNKYISWINAYMFLHYFNLPIVPVIKNVCKLKEALNYDVESLKSQVNPSLSDDNFAEGIVIKPVYEEIYRGHDRFILKKKHSRFQESGNKKKKRAQKPIDPMVDKWKHSVSEYVTENRLLSLFSKKGEIDNPKQIGEYIKEYMEDVRKDFIKDYPEFAKEDLTKKQDKDIFNHSKDVVKMLNRYL